jgi:antitoxin CptB
MSNDEMIPQRLYWACRRGMLELDVLLGNFLKEAYSFLSEEDKQTFARLLELPDPDLFIFLTTKKTIEDNDLAKMIYKIRLHAETRHQS